jgi:hypothetical protein
MYLKGIKFFIIAMIARIENNEAIKTALPQKKPKMPDINKTDVTNIITFLFCITEFK